MSALVLGPVAMILSKMESVYWLLVEEMQIAFMSKSCITHTIN